MAKEIFMRVVATVIALLIVTAIVAYFEMKQKQAAAAAGHPGGCGCKGHQAPGAAAAEVNTNVFDIGNTGGASMPTSSGAYSFN